MRERTPLLFLSDSISSTSGLGRITRDLATRTHQYCSDVFEVATVGYGGPGSRKFPFPEYHLHSVKDWLCAELPSKITGNKDFLPHGIDTTVFNPRDRKESKKAFREGGFQGLSDDSMLIGIVATNQARKNWQLGIETCKILLDRGVDVRLWCHTDILDRYWRLPNLIVDYGLTGRAACTVTRFTDEQMAVMYSACDVTLGIGPEGFGYPIAESLACGTPCVTGSYGAQAEFTPEFMQIEPIAHYYENPFCSKRPVYNARHWADFAQQVAGTPASLPDHVNWSAGKLWPLWQSWLRKGLLK
jgi:glycosyltransferase involved in cell wall biosynthesis